MLSLTLAVELARSGLEWDPRPGDRFVIARTEMIDEIFYLSDMVVEARPLPSGTLFAFNGTTEWALDSVPQSDTVWLPTEGQLRDALGSSFISLTRCDGQFVVTTDKGERHVNEHVEDAYGLALLATLLSAGARSQ